MSKSRLECIFIRAKNSNGKWVSISLEEATNEQFDSWLGMWIRTRALGTRENAIVWLDELGLSPVEIK